MVANLCLSVPSDLFSCALTGPFFTPVKERLANAPPWVMPAP